MLIKKLRLENSWSQEKLAELSSLSLRTIQRIEKDDKASAESLRLISKAFNVNIEELMKEDLEDDIYESNQSSLNSEGISEIKNSKKSRKHRKSFISVNICLFLINIFTGIGNLWFIYPLLGWGIPLFYSIYKKDILNYCSNLKFTSQKL
ncbi:MAG: helix-turn-helix domain-containing protein [Campylobacteraceae bacterium]|nr:helix-turn-helix domain-containing protein [Campylobacteraceae bacterium]